MRKLDLQTCTTVDYIAKEKVWRVLYTSPSWLTWDIWDCGWDCCCCCWSISCRSKLWSSEPTSKFTELIEFNSFVNAPAARFMLSTRSPESWIPPETWSPSPGKLAAAETSSLSKFPLKVVLPAGPCSKSTLLLLPVSTLPITTVSMPNASAPGQPK